MVIGNSDDVELDLSLRYYGSHRCLEGDSGGIHWEEFLKYIEDCAPVIIVIKNNVNLHNILKAAVGFLEQRVDVV